MFFDKLKKLCDEKGISAYKACTDIGLNRAAVAKWKNGSIPSGKTAAKLADYFGVTTDYLLGQEKEKSPTEQTLDEGMQRLIAAILDLPPEKQRALADLMGIDY